MRKIPVGMLKPSGPVDTPILHLSGAVLVNYGEALTQSVIIALTDSDINQVVLPDANEDLRTIKRQLTHADVPVTSLVPGYPIKKSIYDDKGKLLLEAGSSVPEAFVEQLNKRGIESVSIRKSADELNSVHAKELRATIEQLQEQYTASQDGEGLTEEIQGIQLKEADTSLFSELAQDKPAEQHAFEMKAEGEAFVERVRDNRGAPVSDEDKTVTQDTVAGCLALLSDIFQTVTIGARLSINAIDDLTARLMGGVIRHRELTVLLSSQSTGYDYIVEHSLAVAVLSVNIGSALGCDARQIKALCYGALLADIGMLKVSQDILNKTTPLTPREMAEIRRHPQFGLDILQGVRSIPEEVPYVVYQSHERYNGSGYPRGKTDVVTHPFAKIVGVADIYASICSERPYRKAQTPYEGMEQLVLMCGKKQLNPDIVRSFLRCNSLFPVGSFVKMNDGRMARVIYANNDDYMRPLVTVLLDADGQPLPEPERLDLQKHQTLKVISAIHQHEVDISGDPLTGF